MTTPIVSILMPVRDEEAFLPAALRDLTAQTLTDIEILVLDDGSTDDSPAIAKRFADADPRVRVLTLPPRGIVAALNEGLALARGHYVARMDADDQCAPTRLARQVDLLASRPDLGVASCLVGPTPGEQYAGGYQAYVEWVNRLVEPEQIFRDRFVECPIVHPTLLATRELLRDADGWRDGDFPEDYDLILRLTHAGVAMAKVPETLYFWRDRPDRASRRDPRYRPMAFFMLKAKFLSAGPLQGKPDIVVWGAGRVTRKHARPLVELGHRVRAWIDIDPKKIGQHIAGVPVLSPEGLRELGEFPLLVYVGSRSARDLIHARLPGFGFSVGENAWLCA